MSSILIKLPNFLGDTLFAFDLIHTLGQHFDRVALCTSQSHEELFEVFPFPGSSVICYAPENWPRLDPETVASIREFSADTTLLLPNSMGAALALRFAGSSNLMGYATEHRAFLLSKSVQPPIQKMHQTEYYLNL